MVEADMQVGKKWTEERKAASMTAEEALQLAKDALGVEPSPALLDSLAKSWTNVQEPKRSRIH